MPLFSRPTGKVFVVGIGKSGESAIRKLWGLSKTECGVSVKRNIYTINQDNQENLHFFHITRNLKDVCAELEKSPFDVDLDLDRWIVGFKDLTIEDKIANYCDFWTRIIRNWKFQTIRSEDFVRFKPQEMTPKMVRAYDLSCREINEMIGYQ